ncbi:MAG: four helix bundle protein [Lysobacterales bacterium]
MSASHFRELEVWQVAMSLVRKVYALTADWPAEHRFGLAAQIQRASVSIPSNIAEGNARRNRREYLQYLGIASGSTAEVQTQLLIAQDLRLGEMHALEQALMVVERVSQMLRRLQQALQPGATTASRVPGPGSRFNERTDS